MKATGVLLWCTAAAAVCCLGASQPPLPTVWQEVLSGMGKALTSVLSVAAESKCIPIFLTDGTTSHVAILKVLSSLWSPSGVGLFEVPVRIQDANVTQTELSWVVGEMRRLRQLSWCVTVVVVSDDPAFLAAFAQWSLKGRLLVWSTRLLAVTRLPTQQLRALLTSHWTFSMMNTMMMHVEDGFLTPRYSVYVYLPYSPRGATVVQVASWTILKGLVFVASLPLFPEKFSNFHGSTVNVTALPYAPYWMTSVEGNNTNYSGIDYNLLMTLGEALNFSYQVLPSRNWVEVTDQVQARTSFMASIVYVLLPERLEIYDYTHTFDYSPFCFAMAKPTLQPQWQSLYYPLANEVWVSILATALIMCVALIMLIRASVWREEGSKMAAGAVVQEVVGTLLGQGFTGRLSTSRSNRVLVAAWLVFAFILGTAYRGNLTASLTLPKYPPRPETVEELVNTVDRATMESYGISYKRFFMQSESKVFSALGNMIVIGINIIDGLRGALTNNQAQVGGHQYVELMIAQHFTQIDGSSQLYIGREMIIPSAAAWPVPHDAPYKPTLDHYIIAVTEAGLYEQWRKEELRKVEQESRERQREILRQQLLEKEEESTVDANSGSSSSSSRALTIIHMQGPLLLLVLGLFSGGVIFTVEKLSVKIASANKKI